MNKTFFKIGAGLLTLIGMTWPVIAAGPAGKTLHGHVPSVVSHLARQGAVSATNNLHLAIGLELRDQAALDEMVKEVTDPASPDYQHYLTPGEFVQRFAPTEADYQAVIDFAKANGLKVTATHANRMLVEVEGEAAKVQRAFNVNLHTYRHPTENRSFFAPDGEPSVPSNLAILDVSGLNNYSRPHTHLHVRPNATNAPTVNPTAKESKAGSGPFGNYMGNDFRAAYVPGATLNYTAPDAPYTGSGQKVALVQFDGYFANDIATYESINGLPNVALTNILLNGFSGFPTFFGGEVEVSLDIEMVISMAPEISQILVYEGDPFNFFPNTVLNQIAVDDAASQVSCSWGWTGGPNATSDQIFKEMILQGQTFYNASGDSDAFLPGQVDNPGFTGFPSSDPYITQVGATTLTTAGPVGPYILESVWNWGNEFGPGFDGIGSCGGISSYYTIPSWQTNVDMTFNGGSTTHRNIPDVAMVGDNVLVIADGGVFYYGVGGTSCAAPLWAGYTALINQQRAKVGFGTSVGFINPTLYYLATIPNYTNVFHDVIIGNNTWSLSPSNFIAVANYDLCTGLGTPNGTNLINALASTNVPVIGISGLIPAPLPPWQTNMSVFNGGNPNGPWLLYIQDDTAPLGGTNYNGWFVTLTTANPVGFAADNQLYMNTAVNYQYMGSVTNIALNPGWVWNSTIMVTNYGPSVSSNVSVSVSLPTSPGVSLTSFSQSIGTITNYGDHLVWSVTPNYLPVNGGGLLQLAFRANNSGIYTNSATVSSDTVDPNPDDDSATVIASVAVTTAPVIVPRLVPGNGGGFQVSVANDAGASVIIQASTNLVNWLPVYTNYAPFTYTNFDSTNYQKRFYRAVLGP
jgi:subtilase family serine protease